MPDHHNFTTDEIITCIFEQFNEKDGKEFCLQGHGVTEKYYLVDRLRVNLETERWFYELFETERISAAMLRLVIQIDSIHGL